MTGAGTPGNRPEGMTSEFLEDYEQRLTGLLSLGVDPYPSRRDLSVEGAESRNGRVVDLSQGQIVIAYPAHHHLETFATTPELEPLVRHLRPGDVVRIGVRDNVAVEIQPVVIVRRPLEPSQPDPGIPQTRHREQELYWDNATRETFANTARIAAYLHAYLRDRDYLDVAMPVLTSNPDISPNLPFRTSASDGTVLNLRTTYPYSERLLYALERVYQIGPNFRDERAGFERSPEFNMLTIGQAMVDYDDMMDLGQDMIRDVCQSIRGTTSIEFLGEHIDLALPWRRLTTADAIEEHAGVDINACFDLRQLEQIVRDLGLTVPASPFSAGRGQMFHGTVFDVLLKNLVYPKLRQPTFLTEFPYFFGGPGRKCGLGDRFKMRAEGFIAGVEITETASVLTDPRAIRQWHEDVLAEKRNIGWNQDLDVNYLDTTDRGLLLPSVIAFGMERLFMLVLGKSTIDEVMWYSHQM